MVRNENTYYRYFLMLVIDKSLKSKFGYKEEVRIPSYKLNSDPRYQSRKEFTNDRSIRRK